MSQVWNNGFLVVSAFNKILGKLTLPDLEYTFNCGQKNNLRSNMTLYDHGRGGFMLKKFSHSLHKLNVTFVNLQWQILSN